MPSLSRLWCCHCQQLVDATSSGDCILDSLSPPISPMDPNMKVSNPLAHLVFQIALRFLPNQNVSWFSLFKDEVNGKDPNFACPRRYDAVVQPFRSLVGDASLHNEFRQHAAELCGLQEPPAVPKKRRLVLLRRTRHMRSWGDVEELLQGLLAWAKRNSWQVEVLTLGDMEPCEQIAALQDASIAITVYSTEHHLASAFLPEKAVLLVLNTKVKARLKKLEDLRGPGMQRNASVARRFMELCGPWRAAAEAEEAKVEEAGSWEPVLAPLMDNSGTAAARNLMFYAFNNVTCHVLATSKKVVSRTPCGSDDLLVTGAVTIWPKDSLHPNIESFSFCFLEQYLRHRSYHTLPRVQPDYSLRYKIWTDRVNLFVLICAMDEPRAGCRSCWERVDRFGVFGNEDLHGYLRMTEVETGVNVGVNDSTKPLLASLDHDSDPESPGRARRRRSSIDAEMDVVKLTQGAQGTQGRTVVLRPPRSVAGITAAFLCILFGGCIGAAVGYWGLYLEPRMLMSAECDSIKTIQHLGLDAVHVYKILESFYCHSLRTSTLMEVLCPAVVGVGGAVGALRVAYGQAYFSNWTDEESMIELKRLYSLRTVGTKFVLRCWRMRLSMIFCFQVVVMLWLRYTVDLAMDIEAMRIFLVHKQPWFFTLNLLGVFLGLLWTAYEFYIVITTPGAKIAKTEIFFAGLTLPLLGQHVTYLAILSLYTGTLHPFLFVSTLAEAILESSISSFIQTYAVVFTPLTSAQKTQLYISVFSSFISIGYAFSTIDLFQGGRMLVKVPGYCKSFNGRFAMVLLFRVAEITSRATSLALFQAVTRPYGMFVVIAADGIILSVVTIFFQCQVAKFAPIERCSFLRQNFFYVIPSVLFCRMAPILEKDTVITVPPVVYYAIRYLELGAMVAVAAEFLDWDLEEAKHLFEDDGFIVAAFVLSTLVMLVLGIIIRRAVLEDACCGLTRCAWVLAVLDLPDHAADPKAMKVVTKILEQNPTFTSSECHAVAKEAGFPPSAHWDSNFLRAKVVLIIKQALQAVETFDFTRAPNRFSRSTLSSRSLVSIRSTRCTLTCNRDSTIVGQMSTDESKQKFVLECVDQSEQLTSGQTFQLRALASGHLVGLVKTEPLTYELRAQSKWEDEAATLFSALLVHQEIYRSAKAFLDLVHMGADLNVGELHRAKGRKRGLRFKDWDPLGWKIYSINGKLATREVVDEILEKGRGSTVARTYSMDSQLDAVENSNALAKSLRPGAEAAARGEYIVQFVRRDSKTAVMAGSEVLLQHAAGWTEAHMGMSEGFSNEDAEGEAVDRVIKAMFVEGESFQGGLAFTLDPAEYGSKDDHSIYQWTAGLIGTLSDTVQLQQSFSEKYRTMTLVACNARSLGLDHVTGILQADHDLHLRIFLNLLQPILQDIRVEYNFGEETLDVEFDDDGAAVNKPLVVAGFHIDDEDELTPAASAGVQLGDQLLMVEVAEADGRMKKLSEKLCEPQTNRNRQLYVKS
eukprot:s3897_g1.t1